MKVIPLILCSKYSMGVTPSPSSPHKPLSKQMPEAVLFETPIVSLMENSLKLLRHLNPSETENNLKLLGEALPQIKDYLKEIVDVPSKILVATEANNREFLTCELSKSSEGFYR